MQQLRVRPAPNGWYDPTDDSIYADLKPESAEGQLVQEMKEQFEQLQQLFAEALADAGENYRNAGVQKNHPGGWQGRS